MGFWWYQQRMRKPTHTPRGLLGPWLSFVLAAQAIGPRAAYAAPPVPVDSEALADCTGSCQTPLLVAAPPHLAALSVGEDGQWWGQRFDADRGTPLGDASALGLLSTDAYPTNFLHAMGHANGDLVVVGRLRDGRITWMRASTDAARRASARIIAPATEEVLGGFHLAQDGEGTALALFHERGAGTHVTLRRLNTSGVDARAPVHFDTKRGAAPALAVCAGETWLTWIEDTKLAFTRISAQGERAATRYVTQRKAEPNVLGELTCVEGGVRALVGFRSGSGRATRVALAVMTLNDKGTRRTDVALPGRTPRASNWRGYLDVHTVPGGDGLFFEGKAPGTAAAYRLDRARAVASRAALVLPTYAACIPADARIERALCVSGRPRPPVVPGCPVERTQRSLERHGSFLPAPGASQGETYWPRPASDGHFASPHQPDGRPAQLRCGEPGWEQLRQAVETACSGLSDDARNEPGEAGWMCSPRAPTSILQQMQRCTDLPEACAQHPKRRMLSVDAGSFGAGQETRLEYENCSITFVRRGARWVVTEYVCESTC
ncbi:MAG: hypothetical protein RL385_1026 [Pseudomonadota bacterium]|jgi:hypothetical protein